MGNRVLHILSQRPGRTGSGVTLDAMVRQAAAAGWQQQAVVGVPVDESAPKVGTLPAAAVHRVTFATPGGGPADLDYPVPGMSDVMPYPSTVWSAMTETQLRQYREAWRARLGQVITAFRPDVIHSHHIWLVSSLLKDLLADLAPGVRVVVTCHSTGLRQMSLTPNLAAEVRAGCARLDHFCVLRDDHGEQLRRSLQLAPERVTVAGAGYSPEVFRCDPAVARVATDLLYVGKYSEAKGLPWLLEAFDQLRRTCPAARLHVAGSGAGPEAEALRARMTAPGGAVVLHGQLDQTALAVLMQRCGVCVLPSFYEGVPLVLVEAAACGCRLVSADLPGVVTQIAPHLGRRLHLVPLPRLRGADRPEPADLPRFVADLTAGLAAAVQQAAATPPSPADALAPFTWAAVFRRIEAAWRAQPV